MQQCRNVVHCSSFPLNTAIRFYVTETHRERDESISLCSIVEMKQLIVNLLSTAIRLYVAETHRDGQKKVFVQAVLQKCSSSLDFRQQRPIELRVARIKYFDKVRLLHNPRRCSIITNNAQSTGSTHRYTHMSFILHPIQGMEAHLSTFLDAKICSIYSRDFSHFTPSMSCIYILA